MSPGHACHPPGSCRRSSWCCSCFLCSLKCQGKPLNILQFQPDQGRSCCKCEFRYSQPRLLPLALKPPLGWCWEGNHGISCLVLLLYPFGSLAHDLLILPFPPSLFSVHPGYASPPASPQLPKGMEQMNPVLFGRGLGTEQMNPVLFGRGFPGGDGQR